MFWKRKPVFKYTKSDFYLDPPPPAKRSFNVMADILVDAEKYDYEGEKDVSVAMLKTLCQFIENYIEKSNLSQ